MLKYRITYSGEGPDMRTRDVECVYILTPTSNSTMIEFRGTEEDHDKMILAVNAANVAQLELVSGEAVVLEDKIIDGQNPQD